MSVEIKNYFFEHCTHPSVPDVRTVDFINDNVSVALKSDIRKPKVPTPQDSLSEHQQFHYHRVIQHRELHPLCQNDLSSCIENNHSTCRMRPIPGSTIPPTHQASSSRQSRLVQGPNPGRRTTTGRQTYPLIILLIKLPHQSRETELFTLKDNPIARPPDPPEDCYYCHEQPRLINQSQQPLQKKGKSLPRQSLP
ncbi:unnamed protein product [Linum trigynum]|uniref:Uncharacterized protein n=1 Tax=Linum trigynum TaxID=586398 RepID=A0AAV2GXK5_9ROSI